VFKKCTSFIFLIVRRSPSKTGFKNITIISLCREIEYEGRGNWGVALGYGTVFQDSQGRKVTVEVSGCNGESALVKEPYRQEDCELASRNF
jgi:hypothetical protein